MGLVFKIDHLPQELRIPSPYSLLPTPLLLYSLLPYSSIPSPFITKNPFQSVKSVDLIEAPNPLNISAKPGNESPAQAVSRTITGASATSPATVSAIASR